MKLLGLTAGLFFITSLLAGMALAGNVGIGNSHVAGIHHGSHGNYQFVNHHDESHQSLHFLKPQHLRHKRKRFSKHHHSKHKSHTPYGYYYPRPGFWGGGIYPVQINLILPPEQQPSSPVDKEETKEPITPKIETIGEGEEKLPLSEATSPDAGKEVGHIIVYGNEGGPLIYKPNQVNGQEISKDGIVIYGLKN